jgi:hypothetical protein
MKDNDQGVGATAFDLPNSQHPYKENKIRYGNQRVPTPCNYKAEKVEPSRVMKAVLEGK